jgi:hypothetical protein
MSVDRHVIKRGNRYVAVIDAARDPATGKCKQIKRTFPTKREAEVWERQVRAGNDRGEYLQPAKVTIAGYLSRWLAAASHLRPPASATHTRSNASSIRSTEGEGSDREA